MAEDRALRAALDSVANAGLKGADATLSDEDLVSYVTGDLEAEERERMQAVLTASPRMRSRLLELRRRAGLELPPEEDTPIEVLSSREKAVELAKLKARLGIDEAEAPPVPAPLPIPTATSHPPVPSIAPGASISGRPSVLKLAASLLCALLGGALLIAFLQMGEKNETLSSKLDAKVAPSGFVDVRYLHPDGTTRGPTGPSAELGAERDRLLLQLGAVRRGTGELPLGPYRVEIVDRTQADAPVVWSQDDFPAEEDGTLNLLLDRDFLGPGRYQVRLFGSRGGAAPRQIATYSFDM